LLTSDTLPLTLPVAVGANTTLNVVLFPAAIVVDALKPLMLNPVPETLACEIVTLALPPFDKLMGCELLFPVTTFPKPTEEGSAERPATSPVPDSDTVSGEFEALLETVKLPVTAPAEPGLNWIWTVTLWPAAIEPDGSVPTTLKPEPVTDPCEMSTVASPVFSMLSDCVEVVPMGTLPKLTVVTLGDKNPAAV